jgi:YVTN family beta-propeller protein
MQMTVAFMRADRNPGERPGRRGRAECAKMEAVEVQARIRLRRAIGAALPAAAALVLAVPSALAAPHPEIQVGGFPTGIALDPSTDTIYVGNGTTGTLSLIDGRRCNAGNVRGCNREVTAVTAGVDPIGIAVDAATSTLYVANASGTVAVVDSRHCAAGRTSGCRVEPATVRVGADPQFLALDERTHTVYVANSASNTISVIDTRMCNARMTTGCRHVRATIPLGPGPFAVAVSERTNSIYVADLLAPVVSVIDGATCDAANVTGCRRAPARVDVGDTPGGIAVDSSTDTVYVTGQVSDDVSVIDAKTCNGRVRSGCSHPPARIRAGAGARGIAVNEATDTVYVANTGAGTVSVIDGATCNASVRTGCGRRAAVAPVGLSPRRVAVDPVTNTVYVTNAGSNTVTMLDGRTCNGRVHTGCRSEHIA